MVIDSHVHLFSRNVVNSVAGRKDLLKLLHLEAENAHERCCSRFLEREMDSAGVDAALLLPVASPADVTEVNTAFIEKSRNHARLLTAGTLHPACTCIDEELDRLMRNRIKAVKFSTFSQGFALVSDEFLNLLDIIQNYNTAANHQFFVILDTFYLAHKYFKTHPAYTTTPALVRSVVKTFPKINFVAAHMGGLTAPFKEIKQHIRKLDNLFLDTSNAAHTLSAEEFIHLLKHHGPEKILFGTDWPWFHPENERRQIETLTTQTGFGNAETEMIFSGNLQRLV